MSANPYLEGNFAPLASELTTTDLKVVGELPRDLSGRLLRIGPNPVAANPATHHWFVGNGMVHGLRLEEGRAAWYRRRFVRDEETIAKFGQPEIPGPKGALGTNVANTNIVSIAGELYAIVEAGNFPVHLDAGLETLERSDFDGGLKHGFTAHPKVCPDTGEVHAAVYSPFEEYVHHVVLAKDGRVTRSEPVHLPHRPMVHDCAITENYFAVLDFPCVLDGQAGASGSPLPYRWHPELGARVGWMPRTGTADQIRWFEVEPCYVFHPMNAYETGDGRIVMDVSRHPAMFQQDVRGPNEGPPTLDRWTFDFASGNTKEERLDDRGQEFPRIDERRVGKPHRYGYTACFGEQVQAGSIYKHDLKTGESIEHAEGGHRLFLEPVFVPKHDAAAEDEGFVMAYVYDAREDRSDVVVIDAQNFGAGPVATIELPERVPFGFHGNWVPDA